MKINQKAYFFIFRENLANVLITVLKTFYLIFKTPFLNSVRYFLTGHFPKYFSSIWR